MAQAVIEKPDHKQDHLRPSLRINSGTRGVLAEVLRTILFVVVVTVLFDMVVPRSLVDGISMSPTFETDDRLIVSRINYMLAKPNRGEIVVFNSINPNEPGIMLIKRLIGLPGETVEIRGQQTFVNGQLLDEPYLQNAWTRGGDKTFMLGADEYFVMGDNRDHSNDSRAFGPIKIQDIVGEALFRYWPPQKIGIVQGHSYSFER